MSVSRQLLAFPPCSEHEQRGTERIRLYMGWPLPRGLPETSSMYFYSWSLEAGLSAREQAQVPTGQLQTGSWLLLSRELRVYVQQ